MNEFYGISFNFDESMPVRTDIPLQMMSVMGQQTSAMTPKENHHVIQSDGSSIQERLERVQERSALIGLLQECGRLVERSVLVRKVLQRLSVTYILKYGK